MQGREPPVKDVSRTCNPRRIWTLTNTFEQIYTGKPRAESASQGSSSSSSSKTPVVGVVYAPQSANQQPAIPEVERMRRGRPAASPQPAQQPTRQNPSPAKVTKGDPFAALDSKVVVPSGDELSSRFPTLDQFSLLHDHGTKFEFDSTLSPTSQSQSKDLSQRLTERLADDAFQIKPSPSPTPASTSQRQSVDLNRPTQSTNSQRVSPPLKPASAPPKQGEMSRASAIISNTPELKAISSQTFKSPFQPPSDRPAMVSTGTMTTPSPERQVPPAAPYQIYRFPPEDSSRASSLSRQQDTASRNEASNSPRLGAVDSRTSGLPSQLQSSHARHPSSSRPSLEGGRPNLESLDPVSRPKTQLGSRPRPVSTHLESNIDFLREREASSKAAPSPGYPSPRYSIDKDLPPPPPEPEEEKAIESNVEFLRSMEEADHPKKKSGPGKHIKRASLTSLGAGTKNILAGKFGDAFKRFESSGSAPPRTPSPLKDMERRDLTPIAGSEATDGRSDDGHVRDNEEMTPEMRREEEARMLAQEEARVAAAQAEYRQRVAQRGTGGTAGPTPLPKSIGGVSRAISIQNKVQSLLDETSRSSSNVTRTAEGYGRYTDAPAPRPPGDGRPAIPRKPIGSGASQGNLSRVSTTSLGGGSSIEPSATGRTVASSVAGRPTAPPKPVHLNKNLTSSGRPPSPSKPSVLSGDKPTIRAVDPTQMSPAERDDYIRDFQKRFPSLTSIEMVERDLAAEEEEGGGRR